MKRFIDIGEQTGNSDFGINEFSFFDTIIDKFETFNDNQTWSNIKDFISDYKSDNGQELERYLNLIPNKKGTQ